MGKSPVLLRLRVDADPVLIRIVSEAEPPPGHPRLVAPFETSSLLDDSRKTRPVRCPMRGCLLGHSRGERTADQRRPGLHRPVGPHRTTRCPRSTRRRARADLRRPRVDRHQPSPTRPARSGRLPRWRCPGDPTRPARPLATRRTAAGRAEHGDDLCTTMTPTRPHPQWRPAHGPFAGQGLAINRDQSIQRMLTRSTRR
jgi:hypothetical protein